MTWEEDLLQLNREAEHSRVMYVNARHYDLCRRAVQVYGSVHRALKHVLDKQRFEQEYANAVYAPIPMVSDTMYSPWHPRWDVQAVANMWRQAPEGPRPESYRVWVTTVMVDTIEVQYKVKVNLTKEGIEDVEPVRFEDMGVEGDIVNSTTGVITIKGKTRLLRYNYSLMKIRTEAKFKVEDFINDNGRPREVSGPISRYRQLDTNFDVKLDGKTKN